jgi:hypothetical protein
MTPSSQTGHVRLDLNRATFQRDLFNLEKHERHSALETLSKLLQMTWNQVYRDQGLKWEKLLKATPPPGISAVYSFRITQARRAIGYREGDFLRLVSIPPDHDATYGKK